MLNAAAAMAALDELRDLLPVPMQAVREGLMLVELAGRFQILPGRPTIVMDVAHNVQAVGVLAENLSNMGYFPETWAVFSMLSDKDVEGVAERLRGRVDHWLLAGLDGPRGMPAETLAQRIRQVVGDTDLRLFDSPSEAFSAAREGASEDDRIVVFGSFLTVAAVLPMARASR